MKYLDLPKNDRKTNIIYGFLHPDTKDLRYVGQSSRGFGRPNDELRPTYFNRTNRQFPSCCWVRSLYHKDKRPIVVVLEIVKSEQELDEREIYWIDYAKKNEHKLLNCTNGGSARRKFSLESRKKMSLAKLGRPGRPKTKEEIQRIREAKKGIPKTAQHKKRISIAKTGIPNLKKRYSIEDSKGNIYRGYQEVAEFLNTSVANVASYMRDPRRKTIKGATLNFLIKE